MENNKKTGNIFSRLFKHGDTDSAGGSIVSFEIITLNTSGMRFIAEYEIVMKSGAVEVSQYGIRYSEGEKTRVLEKRAECSKERMLQLLNDCDVISWDGFYGKHPKHVLDGIMFSLEAVVNDGRRIKASGSENFPKHYRDFTNGIYEILNGEK
ncbi:MAG: hypothetical protein IJM37_08615 [Lachnospiraceae bacterium]|nr:hypothetical protein [Lachnospiraceae bacterium]